MCEKGGEDYEKANMLQSTGVHNIVKKAQTRLLEESWDDDAVTQERREIQKNEEIHCNASKNCALLDF